MSRQNRNSKALRSLAQGLRLASMRAPTDKSAELLEFRNLVLASSVLASASLRQMIGPNYDLLDVWARAAFLDGWLKGNNIQLPLGGFARRGTLSSLQDGFAVIKEAMGSGWRGDTIHENWFSLRNQNFYKEALEDAYVVAKGSKLGQDEAQDVLQEFSVYTRGGGFFEVGVETKSTDLSNAGSIKKMGNKVGSKVMGNMRNVLQKAHRQHNILTAPNLGEGVQQTSGRGRSHFITQNVQDIVEVLLEQVFYPTGQRPFGAANALIRKIWKAWENDLSETRLAILTEKRRDPRQSDTNVARAVSEQLGEKVTWDMVRGAKGDWETIAAKVLKQSPAEMAKLEDEVSMHISLGLGTHKSWLPLMTNPAKSRTKLDEELGKRAAERLLRVMQRSAARQLR